MIRQAVFADIPRLVELGAVMHAESPVFSRLRFDPQRLEATARYAIEHGFARVYVVGGSIVGGMLAIAAPHWCSSDLVACDLALFIDPAHRGGIAAARLLTQYAQWAQDMGAVMIRFGVTTGVHPAQTQALAETLGWRPTGITMEI